ncbi:MAG: AMP-binding protein [Rhizobacter sp.]|nr:AMP-binding protein [Rhizobacter sp.]
MLELRAGSSPTAIAFWRSSPDNRWEPVSWAAFADRVATLRQALHCAGLRAGDRLALIAPVSLEWELLHHAALGLGAVVVGMDAHDLPARIAAQVELADVAAFVTNDPRPMSAIAAERIARSRFILDLSGTMEARGGTRRLAWADLLELADSAQTSLHRPRPNDLATVIFTSGTTGAPKGIAYTHAQVCLAIDTIAEVFEFVGEGSQLLCWLPLSNLFQRMVNLAAMRKGAATYLLGDPRQVMTAVASASPDIFVGVPRFYEKLYEGIRQQIAAQPLLRRSLIGLAWSIGRRVSRARLENRLVPAWLRGVERVADRTVLRRIRGVMGQRLRCMVTGSAPIPRHLLEEFDALGWRVLEAYGMSENVVPMAMNRPDDFRFGSVGRPLPSNEIVVADGGRIKVRGPGVFTCYLGEPTAPPLDSDGFYLTEDLGRFDADGYLYLTGRASEIIKTSTGRRIAPAPIEAGIRSLPGIDQAMLIGAGRKCLVALCTVQGTITASDREKLEAALCERAALIAEHDRPLAIAVLDHPWSIDRGELTTNLKLRRAVIEERYGHCIASLYEALDERQDSASTTVIFANGRDAARPGERTDP